MGQMGSTTKSAGLGISSGFKVIAKFLIMLCIVGNFMKKIPKLIPSVNNRMLCSFSPKHIGHIHFFRRQRLNNGKSDIDRVLSEFGYRLSTF